jgi:hypothetical protein
LLNPYGVDFISFRQIKKQDDVFREIFVGGLNIRKGGAYLLQAFTELNLTNIELVYYYSQGSVFVMMSIKEG